MMKNYIQPVMEQDDVLTLDGMMELTVSDQGGVSGGGGAGDAKLRDEELEEILSQQKEGWEDGLW